MSSWTHLRHTEAAAAEIRRMAGAVRGLDPAMPVPSCPEWDLAGLVAHTGAVHRWAAAMVRDAAPKRYDRDAMDHGFPRDPAGWPGWLEEGAALLTDALTSRDPGTEMWGWAGDRHARFWSRRQLHETVVHRADVDLAAGRAPDVDEDVAADGVEEFLDVLPYARWRPLLAELRGDGRTLSWQAGTGAGWLVTLTPDGYTWERSGAAGDVTVRAETAAELLLIAWRRRQPAAVEGDETLLRWWAERAMI
ncbi:maleylpyruvate isomerase family mycothiol-dependent enzyme [Microbispora sp. ATCC PTA-5024]|uniref:maleylpyruvate isomerase family mycothiol-dependent enzyme n=1 Tax=Microbispora sp. ATCC PTA-5024 TaxID=316330 RepID=UPI0003DBA68D|nr:maleylpyruvate isomerase family mycothiol-dependent enzyme [Microbispora sp. ATCC PTA-5024]ETK36288.1 hypothetical protein MPTA5024_10025 [Microbispora sp. ATCC PTA-5024]